MAESDANPFQQIVDAELEKMGTAKQPSKRTTTGIGVLKDIGVSNPRATATAAIGGAIGTSAVKQWKSLYKEGLVTLRARAAEEANAVKELAGKGIQAIPRLAGTNAEIKALANQYALEKVFSGFPFVNQKAIDRIGDLKTGRVILTGETVPRIEPRLLPQSSIEGYVRPSYQVIGTESPIAVAQAPKQVTLETAKKIPKLVIPKSYSAPAYSVDPNAISFMPHTADGRGVSEVGRIKAANAYIPKSAPNPNLATRLAETSTSGWLGKGNIALEGIAAGYDIVRPEGAVARGYQEGGGGVGGVVVGGLRGLGRLGRGASNALTMGIPELLGVYDVPDLIGVDMDAERRYMQLRGTAGYPAENFPVERKGGRYVPVQGPALDMIASRIAAERGIESSLMTRSYYKGPEYNYIVNDGKVEAVLKPEYSAMYDARSLAAMDAMNAKRPVLNIDPNYGGMGWQRVPQSAMTFQDYLESMRR